MSHLIEASSNLRGLLEDLGISLIRVFDIIDLII